MVKGQRKEKLAVELVSGEHRILSDVEPKLGGDDLGMNPHHLLEASLAACTIITVQMYASRKNFGLENIEVQVSIISEGEETKIAREIKLIGDMTTEQKNRLIEIANKCPIHRLLESKVRVETIQT